MEPDSIYKSDAARAAIEALYDRALSRLPFPTESRRVDTTFGSTHVLVAGPEGAPPLLALQGGNVVNPLTLAWLTPLADEFRIYAPDTIGQPGKSSGRRVSANDTSLGEWCEQVLDGLGLERPPSSPSRTARASCSASRRIGRRGSGAPHSWCRPASPTYRSGRCLRSPRVTSPSSRSGGRVSFKRPSNGSRAQTRILLSWSRPSSPSAGRVSTPRCRATRRSRSWPASRRRSWSSPASTIPSSLPRGSCPERASYSRTCRGGDARRLPPHPRRQCALPPWWNGSGRCSLRETRLDGQARTHVRARGAPWPRRGRASRTLP